MRNVYKSYKTINIHNMNFDFISDTNFRELLTRDYFELNKCVENRCTKSILVLSGSIIEAILTEYFLQFPQMGKTEAQILNSTLNDLLNWALTENVISEMEKNLAGVVKDYRNLIHPGREIRKGEKFSEESGNISVSVLNIIINSVKVIYLQKYGYSAEEVFEKLKNDWHFKSIFDKVIVKLNQNERVKLLSLLVVFDKYEKSQWECFMEEGPIPQFELFDLEDVKHLILQLKPLISVDVIKSYLQKMIKEIETGNSLDAYSLFHLFHENIDLLSPEEQELIVIYFLNLFDKISEESLTIIQEQTYSTIGKYIKSKSTVKELKEFLQYCAVHFNEKFITREMDLIEQIFNSLSPEIKTLAEYSLTDFFNPKENIPENIKIFYQEALRRNYIK